MDLLDAVAAGRPPKLCRLMTPAVPRPLVVPITSTALTSLNTSHGQHRADFGCGRRRRGGTRGCTRCGSTSAFGGMSWPCRFLRRFDSSEFGDVAALGAGGLLARLVLEAELDGVVAVALRRADLQHGARAELEDGDRGDLALVVVHLRHPDLRTDQTERHGRPQGNNRPQRSRAVDLGEGSGSGRWAVVARARGRTWIRFAASDRGGHTVECFLPQSEDSPVKRFVMVLVGMAVLAFGFSVGYWVGGLRPGRNAYHNRFIEEQSLIAPILANDPAFARVKLDEEYTGHAHLSGEINSGDDYARLLNALRKAVGEKRTRDMTDSLEIRDKPPR